MDVLLIGQRDQSFSAREMELTREITKKMQKSDIYSHVRFGLFLAMIVVSGLFWHFYSFISAVMIFVSLAVIFFVIVGFHIRLGRSIRMLQTLLAIHKQYQSRLIHAFEDLPDDGSDFINLDDDFSGDLDLFGKKSLFHLISVAQTWFGRKTLSDLLLVAQDESLKADDIRKRQVAVKELSENLLLLEEFQAVGKISGQDGKDPRELLYYVQNKIDDKPIISGVMCVLAALISSLVICTLILSLVFGIISKLYLLFSVVISIVMIAVKYQKFKPVFQSVEDFDSEISGFSRLFYKIENTNVAAPLLVETKKNLLFDPNGKPVQSSRRLASLHRICLFVQTRSQPILFVFLNILFQIDYFCVYFLEKWKRESGEQLESSMRTLGIWEALMSLASVCLIYPECDFPVIREEEGAYFDAKEMGHPLIWRDKQVRNHFSLLCGTALITGSNMSGKTTLLRTVGINTVLAYAGTACCANSIELGIMRLGSSMRIADNLGEGLSTFYAELLRIEKIINKAKIEKPLLFLIDEIFRGTNSKDRTEGAKIVLHNLAKPWIIGLMSTHDYELCEISDSNDVQLTNYHFSEYYDEEGIHFDYKLAPGVSHSANARYLMRLIGIE